MSSSLIKEIEDLLESEPMTSLVLHAIESDTDTLTHQGYLMKICHANGFQPSQSHVNYLVNRLKNLLPRVTPKDVDSVRKSNPEQEESELFELARQEPAVRAYLEFIASSPVAMNNMTINTLMHICKQKKIPLTQKHALHLLRSIHKIKYGFPKHWTRSEQWILPDKEKT